MSSTPHDALFKEVYGAPEHAAAALRAVVPAVVGASLDWSTIARCPGSFIDPALRERHTDLLFSVSWHGGGDAFLYLLFEHQSSPDAQMAFRLLRYLVRIWERWWTEHADAKTIPLVMPVVLYHGTEPWSVPLRFSTLFDIPPHVRAALGSHMVDFAYSIDDLSDVPDNTLRLRAGAALLKMATLSLKHARTRTDLLDLMAGWGDLMRAVVAAPHGLEALAFAMRYIFLASDVDRNAVQALIEREIGPEAKETIMTLGERLIEQGRHEGMSLVLLSMLRRRFGAEVDAGVEQRLAQASPAQIELWAERMFSAVTLGELLAV